MQETDLVLALIEELSRRDCNGHATVQLGTAIADPDTFHHIFTRYSHGTYFEHVDLEIQETLPVVECGCGYTEEAPSPDALAACPQCGGDPSLVQGTEFAILEPAPDTAPNN